MIVHRFVVVPVVAVILVVGGCCVIDPPSPMLPAALLPLPGPDVDSLQAHQDSVRQAEEAARAEAARLAAERAAEAERQRAIAAARATLEEMVFFDYDMVEIRDDAAPVLREKVNILRASPQVRLRIEGYCDERGSTAYNLALGNRRAEAIRQFLTGFGLSESRFEIVSVGEGRPLVQGSNEDAWARNRRVEFVITAGANAINLPE
jgi:peptidoglycan-associated lipoprotein